MIIGVFIKCRRKQTKTIIRRLAETVIARGIIEAVGRKRMDVTNFTTV